VAGGGGGHRLLAGQLGPPVRGQRVWLVDLQVRLAAAAVEHVVGGHVHDQGAGAGACLRELTGRVGVHRQRRVRLYLGAIHVGVGGAVEHGVGPRAGEGYLDRSGIGDVELGPRAGGDLVPGPAGRTHEVTPELTAGAGHEQTHGA
jgi:hypothetical protein